MCAPIQAITRPCINSTGGIKKLEISPTGNRIIVPEMGARFNAPIWLDASKIKEFEFRRNNAQHTARSNTTDFGNYIEANIEFSLLIGRPEVEKFLSDYTGKRVDAFSETANGLRRYIFDALVTYTYTSGTRANDPDEYLIKLTAKYPNSTTRFLDLN